MKRFRRGMVVLRSPMSLVNPAKRQLTLNNLAELLSNANDDELVEMQRDVTDLFKYWRDRLDHAA